MVTEMPALSAGVAHRLPDYMTALKSAQHHLTDRGAATVLSVGGFGLFLFGRLTGSLALHACKPHRMLALYSATNALMMLCVVMKLGWISVGALFLSFFFMSISYPTIFALGIHGLREQTKRGASFLVMAILGGAFMPILMGWLADRGGMRLGFLMPLMLFALIASYGASWPKLAGMRRDKTIPA
jgi:MFS transporter, FHS family, L-fucose permease